MILGATPLSYSIPAWLRGQVAIGSFIYSFYRVVLLGIAAACIAGLWFLLQKTSFGRVVRAGVQNPDMVGALGISLQPYMSAVAALGIGLAGLAGVLLAPIYSIHPAMGQEIITPAFVVVVIGGLGACFGLAAYAAALMQRNLMPDSFFGPTIAGVLIVAVVAAVFGFLILRRRGVYFSLLTLALAAMLYAVSFRWTEVTGGENGIGGITRPTLLGFNLESSTVYYWVVAGDSVLVLGLVFLVSPFTVLRLPA